MAAITVGGPFALLCLAMSIKLLIEEDYLPATCFIILFTFLLVCILAVFYHPKTKTPKKSVNKILESMSNPIVDFKVIFSSKDPVEISCIKQALEDNGINCHVFNENASHMMRFVQEIETLVLVHKDDYENSITIVSEIAAQLETAVSKES